MCLTSARCRFFSGLASALPRAEKHNLLLSTPARTTTACGLRMSSLPLPAIEVLHVSPCIAPCIRQRHRCKLVSPSPVGF
jgi:hypothetical protein